MHSIESILETIKSIQREYGCDLDDAYDMFYTQFLPTSLIPLYNKKKVEEIINNTKKMMKEYYDKI